MGGMLETIDPNRFCCFLPTSFSQNVSRRQIEHEVLNLGQKECIQLKFHVANTAMSGNLASHVSHTSQDLGFLLK